MIQTNTAATQHNKLLVDHLYEQIQANNGRISFAEYMQHVLYTPGLGYYSNNSLKFGKDGDFITAPELGTLFAQCLAVQCAEILTEINAHTILEFGAGSGQLACDLLHFLHAHNITLENYYILEVSATLRLRQQEKIQQLCPQYAHIVQWLDHLPTQPINGAIIANEVLDAMPVNQFYFANNVLHEYYVTYDTKKFTYLLDQPSVALANAFARANLAACISQPYTSEINLWLPAWIKSLSEVLNVGAILLVDYGFKCTEYYHPQRHTGTLMCHYRHHCHTDPLINIGLQDITAHVDFTSVANAAYSSGLSIAGYINLASFLINCDIVNFLQTSSPQQAQEVNILTSPAEMGELFKVMALTKNLTGGLIGFKCYDRSYSL